MKANRKKYLPAEWETQKATLLCWPHQYTDWAPHLEEVREEYIQIINCLRKFQTVILAVNNQDDLQFINKHLNIEANFSLYTLIINFDDTWVRDFGPITTIDNNIAHLHGFCFDGWGDKYPSDINNNFCLNLEKLKIFNNPWHQHSLILEGGNLESNGIDTLAMSWYCQKHRKNQLTRSEFSEKLIQCLPHNLTQWLDGGQLEGDDTDGHIDTLVRFVSADKIIYQGCDNKSDPQFDFINKLESQLHSWRDKNKHPYQLIALPWPDTIIQDGRKLAVSYVNFLFVNNAVLVPQYNLPQDEKAIEVIQEALPHLKIIGVPCRQLIWQNGSLHCATMHLPEKLIINWHKLIKI